MLTDEQVQGFYKQFDEQAGCPVTAQDRLAAFTMGAVSMLRMVRDQVSVDEGEKEA